MRRNLLIAALVFLTATSAHSQLASVYVTYSPTHLTNVQTGSPPQYASYWANGVGGGLTLNFLRLPVVSLGLDFRGSTKPGTLGQDSGQVGLKLGVRPPVVNLKLYVEGAAGYLGTRTVSTSIPVGSTTNGSYITWEIIGGIDYPIIHFVDLRLIEMGGGQGINTGTGANANLFTINSGIVVHF